MEQQNLPKADYEYTTLMNMLHVSVSKHLLDEHFTLIWANRFYYDLIGYPEDEYIALYQKQCDRYYAQDLNEWKKISDVVTDALQRKQDNYTLLSRMRRKNGQYTWVRISGTFTKEYIGGHQVAYTVITDIDDIMQMQLERSVTYDALPGLVGKFVVNDNLQLSLLDANRRFIEFFGENCLYSEKTSFYGQNLNQNTEILKKYREKLLTGQPVHFTAKMQDVCKNEFWLQINAACIGWQEEKPVYLVIYIDVTNETELRDMQAKLQKQAAELNTALNMAKNANRAKSDFLSHMSHDIRTPMNAIVGMTDIAYSHLNEPEKIQSCLNKISLSSQHLLGLINDILDMSRIESGKITLNNAPMSLPKLLENIIAIMQPSIRAKKQEFSIRLCHVRHESFCTDTLHLRQIFINILSNAVKFTSNGGGISLDIEEIPSKDARAALLRFIFKDSGIGMKEDFLKNLFEPFTREQDSRVNKTEGSGLGMAITKKLVDLFGGTIEVQSQIGDGTTFFLTLPMQIETRPISDMQFPNLKVLVADDDATICERMIAALSELGVRVETAGSGREALDKFVAAQKNGIKYDGIFLDWKMPDMDGPETAREIRKQSGQALPILIVSAYDWSDIEDEAKAAGITGFISKPLFVSTLCHALSKFILNDQPDPEEFPPPDNHMFTGKRFLLAEDNELNREIAVELLSSLGATIECAYNGAESVLKFQQSPELHYDLILMDIQMPIMNGYTATKKIRSLPRQDANTIPILAMTADAFAEDVLKAKEAGMNGHLPKPLDLETLKREIRKIISGKNADPYAPYEKNE